MHARGWPWLTCQSKLGECQDKDIRKLCLKDKVAYNTNFVCILQKDETKETMQARQKTQDTKSTILLGKGYCPEGFLTITSYCPETLSNVRRCWLAMPLGAGFLCWMLECRLIEKKTKV